MKQSTGQTLYNLLITKDYHPEMLDPSGKPVMDASDATLFSFEWKTDQKNYGTVVILLGNNNELEVYYGDNLGRGMEKSDRGDWYDFLSQMKSFATRNLLTFELNNINRLKYTMQGLAAIKEGLFEGFYGKKNISYSDQPKRTRLMIKHNRNLGEGEARHRAIESLFVETEEGERFKLPFKSLMGGKIMARHVAEGGRPYDSFGNHIVEMIEEMRTMSGFIRAAKNKQFDESASDLVKSGVRHYKDLKHKARRMVSKKGYREEKEKFDPAEIDAGDITVEAVRSMFVEKSIDPRIESALPVLIKLQGDSMKEVSQFENWVEQVQEGTWALPDTPDQMKELKQLMSAPITVGVDGLNATNLIYGLIGDDALFDDIYELSQTDPDADARDLIIARLDDFGIELATSENLDSDGVMMTRPSNMSSESIEEGRMKDQMIGDSEKMSKEEFAKKYGKEAAKEMYDESIEEHLNSLLKLSGI